MLRIRIRVSALIAATILLLPPDALALNPRLDATQYAHTAWQLDDVAFEGSPRALAQTTDGYLWVGTEFGLLRFDGVRFVPWRHPAGPRLPSDAVTMLLADRDGGLWIGTRSGLARFAGGTVTLYPELARDYISAIVQTRDGTVWAGTSAGLDGIGRLCAIRAAVVDCRSEATFGRFVISLYEDSRGAMWVGSATGLWRLAPGTPQRFPFRGAATEIHDIAEDSAGVLILATGREIQQLADGVLAPYAPTSRLALKPTSMLRDRDGALWIGTQDGGVVHVRDGRSDVYQRRQGLSGDFVFGLHEDREGSLWIITLNGLDRLRDAPVASISTEQGLSTDHVTSLAADPDGGMWLGTTRGLNRWNAGRVTIFPTHPDAPDEVVGSILRDRSGRLWVSSERGLIAIKDGQVTRVRGAGRGYVHAMVEARDGTLWLTDQTRGLLHVANNAVVETIPWSRFGGVARALAADPRGGLWLGFFTGGVSYWHDGAVRQAYTDTQGLVGGAVNGLLVDRTGAVWVAAEGGLSRINGSAVATLTTKQGLPCNAVHWAADDDRMAALWLHTRCGLVRLGRAALDSWIATGSPVRVTVYDESDRVPRHLDLGTYGPQVAKATDGRLWFAGYGGASILDPQRIPFNSLPPPVYIEAVTADGTTHAPLPQLQLAPYLRDLRIDYTALSLVAPGKVQFRYKLEGRDRDWVDAGNRRQAFYSDLPPKHYRFRVIAANNDGVWNELGAAHEFSVLPALHQRTSARVGAGVLLLIGLAATYRARINRVRARLVTRFEGRLAERARIAQDLHDGLLQGFASTSMQLYLMADELEHHPSKPKLERILARITQVIDEGRQAVEGLRSGIANDSLEHALAREAEDFRGEQAVTIRATVHGTPRPLQPLVRDEIYRIAREALANVFRHARPTTLEIEVEYGTANLRVTVRDDGCGIEPAVVASGRPGHWGLFGMRERAKVIGATMRLRSRPGAGTELDIVVPATLAFQDSPARPAARRWAARWAARFFLRRGTSAAPDPRGLV